VYWQQTNTPGWRNQCSFSKLGYLLHVLHDNRFCVPGCLFPNGSVHFLWLTTASSGCTNAIKKAIKIFLLTWNWPICDVVFVVIPIWTTAPLYVYSSLGGWELFVLEYLVDRQPSGMTQSSWLLCHSFTLLIHWITLALHVLHMLVKLLKPVQI